VALALACWKLWTPPFQAPAPTIWTVSWLGLELVKIEPGTFLMGSPSSEAGRYDNEGPQTQVRITKEFWMGMYEVTQGQYEAVMWTNPSGFKGGMNLPVETVSWVDATNFCARLTEQERQVGRLPVGYVYRLPTEAEWEYACRAGTTTRFSYGDDPQDARLGEYAWYSGNSGNQTHPVGAKKPNAWGLYDMHGNVWEWCLDWYVTYPGGSVTNPEGPGSGSYRVLRGGSWGNAGGYCRSAYRVSSTPGDRSNNLGFRPVLAPGPPALSNPPSAPNPPAQSSQTVSWLGLELVKIEPGTFLMGSLSREAGRYDDEGPQTQVTISKGFSMGKYEVTQGQYEAVMGTNPSNSKGDKNLPVETVSWDEATNFCTRLTAQERQAGRLPVGYVYRLPTEAEWEYACRARTTTRFSYGDDPQYAQLGEYAWYFGNSGNKTHPVGTRKPNAWGLYDMHGNVWEWCLDWFGTYPGGSVTNPEGPGSGSYRVLRGGSWFNVGRNCRSADRYHDTPGNRYYGIGFRPVLAPGQ
jgi:formylglycine-generating enzyme required for sulfatase activity